MRILVVEDEQKLANAVKKSLEVEGYAVDTYQDGADGLEAALNEEYDLVILDLGLPSMDGLEICKRLRSKKKLIPILMLTARDAVKNKIEGLDHGADDYIIKPFDFEELLARIRALLRRPQENRSPVLSAGDITFDPVAKNVTRGKTEIALSLKEMALLEYLLRNKGKVVSKTQIIEHVWGGEADPFSNVVDVYIGYLRNKLEKPFAKSDKLIITVKGIGYKIEG